MPRLIEPLKWMALDSLLKTCVNLSSHSSVGFGENPEDKSFSDHANDYHHEKHFNKVGDHWSLTMITKGFYTHS